MSTPVRLFRGFSVKAGHGGCRPKCGSTVPRCRSCFNIVIAKENVQLSFFQHPIQNPADINIPEIPVMSAWSFL